MNNQYKYIFDGLVSTPLSEVKNTPDGTETLLIGKVEDIKVKSGMKNGVFIEEYLAAINLKNSHEHIELVVLQENLKQLQKMDLSEDIVFKVMITDYDLFGDLIKSINVLDIINISKIVKSKI